MATVYSLICFQGRTGGTVSFSTSTERATITNSRVQNGLAVVFTTTGTLPTGLTAGTTYYARNYDNDQFSIFSSEADAIANTNQILLSGSPSGTHTCWSAYWYNLSVDAKTRYGSAGSERVYASFAAFYTAIASASAVDAQVAECCDPFYDYQYNTTTTTTTAAAVTVTTLVNGSRSKGWHNGVVGAGYIVARGDNNINMQGYNQTFDGFSVKAVANGCHGITYSAGVNCTVRKLIMISVATGLSAININGSGFYADSVLVTGAWTTGFYFYTDWAGMYVTNCLATGCTTGFARNNTSALRAHIYNSIAIGNTTNWGTAPSSILDSTTNAGPYTGGAFVGGTPWGTSTVQLASDGSDFTNYAGLDFTAASSSKPQINAGTNYYGLFSSDIIDKYRPDYESASYPTNVADIGPFEYDHGEGNTPPNSHSITITGLVSGSRLQVLKGATELCNEVVNATSKTITGVDFGASNFTIDVHIRKSNSAPYYKPVHITGISVAYTADFSYGVQQIEDIARGATKATNWSVNTGTGAITYAGSAVQTLQELYSYIMDYYDHADRIELDDVIEGTTSTQFSLVGNGSISDADMEHLNGGSLWLTDGTTLWANVTVVGSVASNTYLHMFVNGTEYTRYWGYGTVDVLLKMANYDGTEVVDVRARKYTDTYDHWQFSSGLKEGQNYAAISTIDDSNNQTARTIVDDYTITITVDNPTGKAIDGSDTPADYTITVDAGGCTVQQAYEYFKFRTDEDNTTHIGSVDGNVYVSANISYAEVKASPLGTFAGGVLFGARGIWIENIATADALNYVLTDNAGTTHQATPVPGQISATVLAGSRVQLYNVTTNTEIENVTEATTSYTFVPTTEASDGDTLRLRACKLGYEPVEVFAIFDVTAGASFLVTQTSDAIYTAWGVDGSTVSEFTLDVTGNIEIDANDVDGNTTKVRLGAWYNYILTTENGIRYAFGAITYLATNAIRINVDTVDLTIENVNASTALVFTDTDVRLYRSDGTTIIAATSYSIHNDYSGVPDVVETGVSGLTASESNQLFSLDTTNLDAPVSKTLTTAKFLGLK